MSWGKLDRRLRTALRDVFDVRYQKLIQRNKEFGEKRRNQGITITGKRKLSKPVKIKGGDAAEAFQASLPYGSEVIYDSTEYANTQSVFDELIQEEEGPDIQYDDAYFQIYRPDGLVIVVRARLPRDPNFIIDINRPYKLEAVLLSVGHHFNDVRRGNTGRPDLRFSFDGYMESAAAFSWIRESVKPPAHRGSPLVESFSPTVNDALNATFSFVSRPWEDFTYVGNNWNEKEVLKRTPYLPITLEPSMSYINLGSDRYRTHTGLSHSQYFYDVMGSSAFRSVLSMQGKAIKTSTVSTNTARQEITPINRFAINETHVTGKIYIRPTFISSQSAKDIGEPSYGCEGIKRRQFVESRVLAGDFGQYHYSVYKGLFQPAEQRFVGSYDTNLFNPSGYGSAYCTLAETVPYLRYKHNGNQVGNVDVDEPHSFNVGAGGVCTDIEEWEELQYANTSVGIKIEPSDVWGHRLEPPLIVLMKDESGNLKQYSRKAPRIEGKFLAEPGVAFEIYEDQLYINTNRVIFAETNLSPNTLSNFTGNPPSKVPSLWRGWLDPKPIAYTDQIGTFTQLQNSASTIETYQDLLDNSAFQSQFRPRNVILHVQETEEYYVLPAFRKKKTNVKFVEWTTEEAGIVYFKYGPYSEFLADPFRSGPRVTSSSYFIEGKPATTYILGSYNVSSQEVRFLNDRVNWNENIHFPISQKAKKNDTQVILSGDSIGIEQGLTDAMYDRNIDNSLNAEDCAKSRRKLQLTELILHVDELGQLYRLKQNPNVQKAPLQSASNSFANAAYLREPPTYLLSYSLFDILGIPTTYRTFIVKQAEEFRKAHTVQAKPLLPRISAIPLKYESNLAYLFTKDGLEDTYGKFKMDLGYV